MSRYDKIFRNGFFLAILGEVIALFTGNMMLLDVSIVALMTIFILWQMVMYSDHRTAKMARNRKKREPGR